MRKSVLFVGIVIILGILIGSIFALTKSKQTATTTTPTETPTNTAISAKARQAGVKEEPLAVIKNIGFNLDTYNPTTKKAGALNFVDMPVLKDRITNNRIWVDYGTWDRETAQYENNNPQSVFILPAGTPITAMLDGEVDSVSQFDKSGDYSVLIKASNTNGWRYEHEHVVKPRVKQGDKVKAGDVIAEVGPQGNWEYAGHGIFEVGLFHPHRNGRGGTAACVFKYLDPTVKEDILAKTTAFYTAWESFRGDSAIYNQDNYAQPGCEVSEMITWDQPAAGS